MVTNRGSHGSLCMLLFQTFYRLNVSERASQVQDSLLPTSRSPSDLQRPFRSLIPVECRLHLVLDCNASLFLIVQIRMCVLSFQFLSLSYWWFLHALFLNSFDYHIKRPLHFAEWITGQHPLRVDQVLRRVTCTRNRQQASGTLFNAYAI